MATKERMKEWRAENKERLSEYKKKYESSPERKALKSQKDREYREKNSERLSAQRAEYREKNRELIRENARKYYKEKPECFVLHNIKTRAKKNGVPFDLVAEDLLAPEFCPVLGMRLERSSNPNGGVTDCAPTVDRLIPELGYVRDNIIIVSHKANRIKNDSTIEELEAVARFYRNIFTVKRLMEDERNGANDCHAVHGD